VDVFVSHARADREPVDEIVEALEARGKEVWIDREDIAPTDEWMRSIRDAIDQSDSFLVFLSPAWLGSERRPNLHLGYRHASSPQFTRAHRWVRRQPGL
jgi:hypothetical protein